MLSLYKTQSIWREEEYMLEHYPCITKCFTLRLLIHHVSQNPSYEIYLFVVVESQFQFVEQILIMNLRIKWKKSIIMNYLKNINNQESKYVISP